MFKKNPYINKSIGRKKSYINPSVYAVYIQQFTDENKSFYKDRIHA